ncbi:unnamed protein product [Taenia asiatica]|uniref:Expressed conserved protein n=1 Tax=Taenia asiatica TaxID=60517 RepID=A0A0R3VUS9_TAEAS|nr:unnamed protein product [Taenia asiatica]
MCRALTTTQHMDRQIAYVVIAFVASLLFFVAIGYDGWRCGGSILGPFCRQVKEFEIIGALILTAALLTVIAAIVLILSILMGNSLTKIVSAVITTIAATLAIAGTFYYLHFLGLWSPFIATMAMTLVIVLAALILTDFITSDN